MPTYVHFCEDKNCSHEWEDYYSIKQDPPKVCPKCKQETARRGINNTNVGVVELTGKEYVAKVKADAQKFKKDIYNSEKLYSNVLGESKYQEVQTKLDAAKKERGKD